VKALLEPEGLRALARFASPGTLVALDYDGTLAPIVPRPADAAMRPETRELLARLCRRFQVVILTGRSRGDVLRFLGGTGPLEVIGSHGLETFGAAVTRFSQRVARWRETLHARLRAVAGIDIEDKRLSLAVHYRRAADDAEALLRIRQAVADLAGARVFGGKKVVNLVPSEAPDKGAALLGICARTGCARAVYVGDDETDEDVFRLRRPDRIFTVRIGCDAGSAADYFIPGQEDVDQLLGRLLAAGAAAGDDPGRQSPSKQ